MAEDIYVIPGSYGQQGLWLLQQRQPRSSAYNMAGAIRLRGPVNLEGLLLAINSLTSRHEILRTSFRFHDGSLCQVIFPELSVALPLIDLTLGRQPAQTDLLKQGVAQLAREPFDLMEVPLLRACLVRLAEREHVLVVVLHHIICDGWSVSLIVREIVSAYQAFCLGRKPDLPPLAVQYADYSLWQRDRFNSGLLDSQLDYWKRQLDGSNGVIDLATDFARPPVQSFSGSRLDVTLEAELSSAIRLLSRKEGVTEFMLLMAAFNLLLYRYSSQADICVGTVVAGRHGEEFEGLVGFFANTVVIRTRLAQKMTFLDLLQQVKQAALDAYANQEVPFEKVVEQVAVGREMSHTPLFQVMLAYNNTTQDQIKLEGLEVEDAEVITQGAKFDLMLSLQDASAQIRGSIEYSSDLFREETISRLWQHYRRVLEQVLRTPAVALRDVQLISEMETAQISKWNETHHLFQPLSIHQMFEEQAAKIPELVAIKSHTEEVTYEQLNRRANRLGHFLRSRGVGPEQVVAVMLERGSRLVEALLGVLKAGAAYLPLEKGNPPERVALMLDQCGVSVILTHSSLRSELPKGRWVILSLDELQSQISSQSTHNVKSAVELDNLAYVIYTSGSTGSPKGVMISNRSISNHLQWRRSRYPLTHQDAFLQKASVSFDISVWEIFGTLVNGGRLVMVGEHEQRDSRSIVQMIRQHEVTVAHFGPGMLEAVLREGIGRCESLRLVYCGGEELSPETERRFFEQCRAELKNQYGPTEATVDATIWDCDRDHDHPSKLPIGRPIANTQVSILDEQWRNVPVGIVGEIYLSGEGLARGYVGRPQQTAESFIPNPFATRPGDRMYRTGDLGRFRPDGNIDYIGRRDLQVKVRGYRIELEEVESAIKREQGVTEAVVMAEGEGEKRILVGYIEGEVVIAELRKSLSARLPYYMVPTKYERVTLMPRTLSGKVDRQRLRAGVQSEESRREEAKDDLERELIRIWKEVLGVNELGATENFFEAGGNSLLAMQVVTRIRKELGVELQVADVFERGTVREISEVVSARQSASKGVDTDERIKPAPRLGPMPLSFAQQRLWFVDQLEQGNAVYNIPAAVRFEGPLSITALRLSLDHLIGRHEILRTSFEAVKGQPVQVIRPSMEFSIPVIDLSDLRPRETELEIERVSTEEAQQPFDLKRLPLMRAKLLLLAEHDHILLLTMHHIISDGWSRGVLVREIVEMYEAYSSGSRPCLPELKIQYADFAQWQRNWMTGEVLDQQIRYWRKQLGSGVPELSLPTDRPRPPVPSYRGAVERFDIAEELVTEVRQLSRQEGVTMFITLLAAFKGLLQRYTGQQEIVIGAVIANRNREETEGLIGFFVNMLALKTEMAGERSFRELMKLVKQVALGAYSHQDVPFEKVVEELQPQRGMNTAPLFQVVFVLQNAPTRLLEIQGLTVSSAPINGGLVPYDLILSLEERDGRLNGSLAYTSDLFDASTIRRMTRDYEALLEAATADPDRPLISVTLLNEEEAGGLCISDFPDAQLSQGDFEQLVRELSRV